jgi:hypothetical protein
MLLAPVAANNGSLCAPAASYCLLSGSRCHWLALTGQNVAESLRHVIVSGALSCCLLLQLSEAEDMPSTMHPCLHLLVIISSACHVEAYTHLDRIIVPSGWSFD